MGKPTQTQGRTANLYWNPKIMQIFSLSDHSSHAGFAENNKWLVHSILECFEYIYFNFNLRSSKISPSFSITDAAVWQYALIAFQFNLKFQKQKSFNAPRYNNDSLVSVWQIKAQCVLVSIAKYKADYFSHVYLAAVKVTMYHDKSVIKIQLTTYEGSKRLVS